MNTWKNTAKHLFAINLFITHISFAEEPNEEYIKPLQVEPDINNVDLLSGKFKPDYPALSIPAAPNLSLKFLQQFDIKLIGTLYETAPEPTKESYSISYGSLISEYLTCTNTVCSGKVENGSRLTGNMYGNVFVFRQGKSGIKIIYDKKSYLITKAAAGVSRQGTWYASKIVYPDGEQLSLTYDTAVAGIVTYYRPILVVSNTGYQLQISYQSNDLATGTMGWSKLKTAAIASNSAPTVALAKHTVVAGAVDTLTDLQGRTWTFAGINSAIGERELVGSHQATLPGDTVATINVSHVQFGNNRVVKHVQRQGMQFDYQYVQKSGYGFDPDKQFSKITITGPHNYQRVIDFKLFAAPEQRQQISASTDSNGHTTRYQFNADNLLAQVTYPEQNQVQFRYDRYGNLIERREIAKPGDGGQDIVNSALYPVDSCNDTLLCFRPEYVIDGNGNRTDYTFDPIHGGLLTKLEPAGDSGQRRKTRHVYQTVNGLVRLAETHVCGETECGTAQEQVTLYRYWHNTKFPQTVTQTNGTGTVSQTTTYSYDAAGRQLSEDGPLSGSDDAKYARYDNAGRKTWDIGPVNQQGLRVATRTTFRSQDEQPRLIETGTVTTATSSNLVVATTLEKQYSSTGLLEQEAMRSANAIRTVKQIRYNALNKPQCVATRMNPETFTALPDDACSLGVTGIYDQDRVVYQEYDALGRLTKTVSGYGTAE